MTIFVGSTNPVKINAVKYGVTQQWPEALVTGFETQSGVSEQPMSDDETHLGARNRAQAALKAGLKTTSPQQDETYLGVGLEGGVFETESGEMWTTVWASVVDQKGHHYDANGARIQVPEVIAALIREGQEMGPVMQQLTGIDDVRKKQGMFGVVTQNFVDRTEEYGAIAKIALGLWFGKDWDAPLKR